MMVPSWLRGPLGEPTRDGASRPCCPISRETRRRDVQMPPMRSRAHTLRWPSPWKGQPERMARVASSSAAFAIGPDGPRRRGGDAGADARCRWTVARDMRQTRQTRASP